MLLLTESPKYLYVGSRYTECANCFEKMGRFNGISEQPMVKALRSNAIAEKDLHDEVLKVGGIVGNEDEDDMGDSGWTFIRNRRDVL